jgi:hypothetical protein
MGLNAFTVLGNTAKMTAASTPPTPIQVSSTTLGGNQYRIINLSTTTDGVSVLCVYCCDSNHQLCDSNWRWCKCTKLHTFAAQHG